MPRAKPKKVMPPNQGRFVRSSTPRWHIIAASAATLTIYVALRLPGIGIPLDRDEGAFGYIGQMIRDGKLPYRDCLDHKPPIAFYINALALQFVPPTERGIHIFLLLYNFLTLVCIFYLGKSYFRSLSAGLWSAFAFAVFSASPAIQGFTASTEMWMLLPIVLSLLLAVLAQRRNSYVLLFLSGIAGAVACWTRQTAFTCIVFIVLFVCMRALHPRDDPAPHHQLKITTSVVSWGMGAAILSALLILYFYSHGIFREFIYWNFIHNLVYTTQPSLTASIDYVKQGLMEIFRGDFILLLVGAVAAIWRVGQKKSEGYFLAAFLLLSLIGTIPGFGYPHYFAQLAPAVAVAAGYGFFVFFEHIHIAAVRFAATACCSLLILIFPIFVNRHYFLEKNPDAISRYYFEMNPFPESKLLASFLTAASAPDDPVLIVGSEPQILFYSGRKSPSPFTMMYPLTASRFSRHKEFQQRMWEEVQKTPPKFIIFLMNVPNSFSWDGIADLEIIRNLEGLVNVGYRADRAVLVTGFSGEWVNADDNRLIDPKASFIYVFERL